MYYISVVTENKKKSKLKSLLFGKAENQEKENRKNVSEFFKEKTHPINIRVSDTHILFTFEHYQEVFFIQKYLEKYYAGETVKVSFGSGNEKRNDLYKNIFSKVKNKVNIVLV